MKIIFMIVLLSLTIAIPSFADNLCQFKDIPFGTTKKEVLDKLGYDLDTVFQSGNTYYIHGYELGDREVTLFVEFDDNDKFYHFGFNFEKYAANRIDDKLADDLLWISDVFVKKYGKPTKSYRSPKFKILSSEGTHYFAGWGNKKCQAYTGVVHYESQFYARSAVYDTKLHNAQSARDTNKELNTLKQATKDF